MYRLTHGNRGGTRYNWEGKFLLSEGAKRTRAVKFTPRLYISRTAEVPWVNHFVAQELSCSYGY